MKNKYSVILYPMQTEKGTVLQKDGKYIFAVSTDSNKLEIKWAVEQIYSVDVISVNTMNVKGKRRRVRLVEGKRSDWKKAVVTLKKGETIDLK